MKTRMLAGAAAALCCAGLAMAQPANDTCANATAVAIPSVTSGTTVGATVESPAPPTCVTSYSAPGVWYTLVGNGHTLTVDVCNSTYDTKLHVYCNTLDACTSGFGCVTGNDDTTGCGSNASRVSFCSATGQTYYILVSGFSSNTGDFMLNVADGDACSNPIGCSLGACCSSSGVCTSTTEGACTGSSTFQGAGTTCSPDPCAALIGACCGTGSSPSCTLRIASGCTGTSTFLGAGTVCSPSPCAALVGACCSSSGSCSRTTANACTGTSGFQGVGTTCTPTNPCTALVGACCNNTSGACSARTALGCDPSTSTFQGTGTSCTPSPCPASGACCVGSCCSVMLASVCATNGGAYQGDSTTCSPNPCPAPTNDLCANAIAVTAGVPVSGDNCNATSTGDGPAATCQASSGKGVWYSFASPGGLFDIGTCGSPQDTVLTVFTSADCATFTQVGCDDDTCDGVNPPGSGFASFINNLDLPAGTYLIRVSSFGSAPAGNTFTLLVSSVTTGACCDTATGVCSLGEPGACPNGATYEGDGTVCSPNPCPQPVGACCTPDGGCSVIAGADCATAGGLFQGNGSACNGAIDPCPSPAGACCNNSTGACTYVAGSAACASGSTYSGDGSVCSPNTCPQPGACCVAACCTVTLQANCTGTWGPANSTCSPSPCGALVNDVCAGATPVSIGANPGSNACSATEFTITPAAQCGSFTGSGGSSDVWHSFTPAQSANYTFDMCATPGFDTVLALYESCPADGTVPPRACNDDAGSACAVSTLRSRIADQLLIAGNTYYIRVANYGSTSTPGGDYVLNVTQGSAAGACCDSNGNCTLVIAADCTSGYQGDFTSCSPNPCPPPTGACCCGSTCSATLAADCTGVNQTFIGAGTVCNASGNIDTPCCLADYNHAGGVSVQDIFDFLAGYFSGNTCADINGGGVSVQDIFDYLAAYFTGCP